MIGYSAAIVVLMVAISACILPRPKMMSVPELYSEIDRGNVIEVAFSHEWAYPFPLDRLALALGHRSVRQKITVTVKSRAGNGSLHALLDPRDPQLDERVYKKLTAKGVPFSIACGGPF